MTKIIQATALAALLAGGAQAGGIDRSGQPIDFIFESGTYVTLGLGVVNANLSGNDVAAFGGGPSGDVADPYFQPSFSIKTDLTDKLSFGLLFDNPFGADVVYDPTSVALGGTFALAEANAFSGVLRYKFSDRFSVHGGVRLQNANGNIGLTGAAYGGVSGYAVTLGSDLGYGYLVGAAYEIPEIALRVALTYNSAIEHDFATVETLGGGVIGIGTTTSNTPQSVNLDFQTGIAEGTLLFGGVRWAEWSDFRIDPTTFVGLTGGGLIDLDDTTTYTLGIGRQFTDTLAGSFSVQYEEEGDPLVSPLAPSNGRLGATLAVVYTHDNMTITGGINYTKLGDANPETGTPDTARANFTGNDSIGVGIQFGWQY